MIKENIGPGKGSAGENEAREGKKRREKQTQEWEIEDEIPLGFLSSSTILLFISSVSRSRRGRRRRRRRRGNHSALSLGGDVRMRRCERLPLIASLTPESCRFLTDMVQVRWRRSNGGDFCAADESEAPYQTRGAPRCHVGEEWTRPTFPAEQQTWCFFIWLKVKPLAPEQTRRSHS